MSNVDILELFGNKKYEEIIFSFENIYPNGFSEKIVDNLIVIIKSYKFLGRLKEANDLCEKLISIYPSNIRLHIEFAEIAMSQEKWDTAINRWNALLKIKYHSGAIWRLARAFLSANRFVEASSCLEEIRNREGPSDKVRNFRSLIDSAANKKYSLNLEYKSNNNEITIETEVKKIKGKINDFEKINLKGWVKIPYGERYNIYATSNCYERMISTDVLRSDVVAHFKRKNINLEEYCGFEFLADLRYGLSIYLECNGIKKEICKISLKKILDVTEGRNGWLFLANDANKSIDQYSGKALISEDVLKRWGALCKELNSYRQNIIFVISNSKEYFASKEMPFQGAKKTNLDTLCEFFDGIGFNYINPLERLKQNPYSYYKTDTHWSDEGAYIAYLECMQRLGLNGCLDGLSFSEVEVYGDLGSKLSPPRKSLKRVHSYSDHESILMFSSGFSGTGAINIWENKKYIKNSTVVLFGGSSLVEGDFQKYFSYFFRRVIAVNAPGSLIKEIVEHENPDYLLIQTNERYILTPGKICNKYLDFLGSRKVYPKIKNISSEIFYKNLFKNF